MNFQFPLRLSALSTSVIVALSLASAGCSPEGKKLKNLSDAAEYRQASCKFDYSEGGVALRQSSSKIQNSHFGKRFDISLLAPVLGASAEETVRFAENTEVRFYKTEHMYSGTCDFSKKIPSPPADLDSKFSSIASEMNILGLYLPIKSPNLPSTNSMPAIIVRKDTNKWVLVHEYMHHLFTKQYYADGNRTDDLQTEFRIQSKQFELLEKQIASESNSESKKTLVNSAAALNVELNELMFEILRQFYLEEMTIETILGEKFASNEMTFVHGKQRINGALYTISSSEKIEAILASMDRDNAKFKTAYLSMINSAQLEKQNRLPARTAAIRNELGPLRTRAVEYLSAQGLKYQGLTGQGITSTEEETSHVGCAHGRISPEVENFFSKDRNKDLESNF